MEKIQVKLIQHTPLLHFQYDSEGATLRATEVKPKLDKFLVGKLLGKTREETFEQCKEFLVGYSEKNVDVLRKKFCDDMSFNTLNYKMSFKTAGEDKDVYLGVNEKEKRERGELVTKQMTENFPLLLSNMGGKDRKEELVNLQYSPQGVTMTISISIIKKNNKEIEINHDAEECLRSLITKNIEEFFALNNFGQRSGKGFGSFMVEEKEQAKEQGNALFDKYPCITFRLSDNTERKEMYRKLFLVIDFYWKTLKSGINYTKKTFDKNGRFVERKFGENYIKSYLYRYLNQKNLNNGKSYTWEKKEIKQKFKLTCQLLEKERKEWENDAKERTPVFARALLGYPSSGFAYRWQKEEGLVNKTVSVSANKGIARIPSPIIFKPVLEKPEGGVRNVKVYILFNESLISALQSKDTVDFYFECCNRKFNMPTPMNVIDYRDLIDSYHKQVKQMRPISGNGRPILDKKDESEYVKLT